MSQISVLIVDDNKEIQIEFKRMLQQSFFKDIYCASTISEMLSVLKDKNIDIVLLDNHLGNGIEGHYYIEEIKKINNNIEIIMITADRSFELIINSIKSGAFYFLPKDNFDPFELATLINKAADLKRIKEHHKSLSDAYTMLQENDLKFNIIGTSKHLNEIKSKLEKLSLVKYFSNGLLIVGEQGVGKSELAKYYYSLLNISHKFKPFFRVQCDDIDKDRFKELFFGSGKKKGIIEIANNSVILLENISELNKELQKELHQILTGPQFTLENGLKKDNQLTVIMTSDIDPKTLMENGQFNKELYYELSSISLTVRPIRDRKDDIAQLIEYCIKDISQRLKRSFPPLPQHINNLLMSYSWPGNIPELKASIEKLFIFGYEDGEYNINELPEELLSGRYILKNSADKCSAEMINEIFEGEKSYAEKIIMCKRIIIETSLKKNNFIITQTAKSLQKNRCSLYREINELEISCKGIAH